MRDVWVVDCSSFMPLLFVDERAEDIETLLVSAATPELRLLVPSLFWYEVTNVLHIATAKGRISEEDSEGGLYRFTGLPIETDIEISPAVVLRIGRFASDHKLTAYDAAYFELADRHSANLLTLDKDLLRLQSSHPWIHERYVA